MFFRRLYLLLAVVLLCGTAVAARLVQIQVLDAPEYTEQAEDQLIKPLRLIPPIRGEIRARNGQLLVNNEPQWQVCVDYAALAATPTSDWTRSQARTLLRQSPPAASGPAQAADLVLHRVDGLLARIAQLTGVPVEELQDRRHEIVTRVQTIKKQVIAARNRPVRKLALEQIAHPLVGGLSRADGLRLREALAAEPWCRVEATEQRAFHDATAFAHLLGRTGPVSPQLLQKDPHAGDRRREYRPDERVGLTGVERLADEQLRGLRGYVLETRDAGTLDEVRPEDGRPVFLSLDERLQTAIYSDFARYVAQQPFAIGGAVVVLDIQTRELLALVSYPGYDPGMFSQNARALLADAKRRPLLHRAVQGEYPPGSILKPVVLAGALSEGVISPATTFTCRGYLYEPTSFRCWISKFNTGHGPLDAQEALKYSCNVYLYHVGMAMGTPRLTEWFDRFGLGRPTGVGLIDEADGVNPTPAWLGRVARREVRPADCRNFAIGQGEVTVSPLQAANFTAEVLTGKAQAPTLLRPDPRPRPVTSLGLSDAAKATIRRGMYRVVNDATGRKGTAYNYVRMEQLDVGGKTGTAQASRLDIDPDPKRRLLYPPADANAAKHAWFTGFAPAGERDTPRIVVTVFLEYGGGGGQTAGPMAKAVFARLIDLGYLQPKPGSVHVPAEDYLPPATGPTTTEPVFSPGAIQPLLDETTTEPPEPAPAPSEPDAVG